MKLGGWGGGVGMEMNSRENVGEGQRGGARSGECQSRAGVLSPGHQRVAWLGPASRSWASEG